MRGRRQKLRGEERRKRLEKRVRREQQREQARLNHLQGVIAPQSKVEVVKDLAKLRRKK